MAFDPDVPAQLIVGELFTRGRGSQTRLAEAIGVTVQTVNKWAKEQTTPEPSRWPAIEAYFGWPTGTLELCAGMGITEADEYVRRGQALGWEHASVEQLREGAGPRRRVEVAALKGGDLLTPEQVARVEGFIAGLLDSEA